MGSGGGFQQGLSGLNAAQRGLEVVSNNISNANAIGFKSSSAEFADVFARSFDGASSASRTSIGLGTKLNAVQQNFTQGNITVTGNPLDLAINGTGFFKVNSTSGEVVYTRNGQFSTAANGNVVNSKGDTLQGFAIDQTTGRPADVSTTINIPQAAIAPSATAATTLEVNLDAREAGTATAFSATDLTSFEHSTTLSVFDQLGEDHTMNVYFKRTPATNTWQVFGRIDGTDVTLTPATVTFNADGNLTGTTQLTVDATAFDPAFSATNTYTFDLANSTQFGSAFQVQNLSQDGYSSAPFSGFSVGADGVLTVNYANGETKDVYKVGLFKFKNPEGLQPIGASGWLATDAAGPELVSLSDETAFGTIQSGALEEANVDLTAELVAMISAQRVYQANSQTIKTQDQLLQTITNLR
ncbi:MAG: flagellar hook protein FlgE [Limnobacter sp.]|nr:flagellar hook protein FlgE [Limnobacter sp.]